MRVTEPYTIYPRTLASGKTVYYYQFRMPDGTRSTAKSTGCSNLASAKRYCNKLYNQGEFRQNTTTRFSVFAKDFFDKNNSWYKWKSVNNAKITDETILAYNKWLNNQVMPYFENYQLSAITRATVKDWIIWASDKWSAKTVNNGQTVLNIILKSAVDKGLIDFNPAAELGFRKCEKIKRDVWTTEEIRQIYKSELWSCETLRNAFLLGAITGMRISEIAGLSRDCLHDDYIMVKTTYSRKFGIQETTKNKTSRIVPIPEGFVFPDENEKWVYPAMTKDKPFNICRMHEQILLICGSLGIDCKERKLTTHVLRDFYNTYLESENITDAKIKAVIGHKDPSMTGHYTYWKPDMFTDVHEVQNKLYNAIRS